MGLSTIHVFRLDQVKERSGSVVEQDFDSSTGGIRRLLPVFGRIEHLAINQESGGQKLYSVLSYTSMKPLCMQI